MTFEQLECFIYAVQENTFFDAAEALHITQSSLSKQIKKMEQELGIQLFDRSKRSAVLTQAGEFFYPEAQKLSLQYQQTIAKMKEFNTRFSSSLCVGTLPVLSQYGLTHFFHQFATLHPEISLSLFEVEEPELMAGFEKGRFDCIIARESMITDPDCIFIPMASDTLSVILPLSHPLARRDEISIHEISRESFILMHPYTSIHQLCLWLFDEADICPHILRTVRLESIISAVEAGEGISLFAQKNFDLFQHTSIVSVPLKEAPPLITGAVFHSSKSNASKSAIPSNTDHLQPIEILRLSCSSYII